VTVADALRAGAARLQGVADNPRLEARLLLAHALGCSQNDLIREPERVVDPGPFETLVDRRLRYEPIAHIVGRREFWSLGFEVSPATLIPRPDSETLIEAALAAFRDRPPPRQVLDLGTGTGCLLLALLHEYPSTFGIGVDLEPAAAALARRNATRLGLIDRAGFYVGDWTNAVRGRFDLVVSNPPYIADGDMEALMPDVARYEPRLALAAGADGGDAYRAIIPALPAVLEAGGVAILEIGAGQAEMVGEIARSSGLGVSLRRDLAGIPRAISVLIPPG
jgi:release factor glutamine methyltransferase